MTLFAPPIPATPFKGLWAGFLSKARADSGDSADADSALCQSRSAKDTVARRSDVPAFSQESPGKPQTHTPQLFATCDVAIEDWDVLLSAVKARLRFSVSETFATPLEPHLHDQAERIRSSVLECADALDQLHATLSDEFGQRKQS